MQTVAILQKADFSHNQPVLSFGASISGFDGKSNSFGDASFIQKNNEKESFESMIQKASLEKSAQEEKRTSEREPVRSSENFTDETKAEKKNAEIPFEKTDAVAEKDETAAEVEEANVQFAKKNSYSKTDDLKKNTSSKDSAKVKNTNTDERSLSENVEAMHSISETKRLSDSSKGQKNFEKRDADDENEFLEKIMISDEEYALLAMESASSLTPVLKEEGILSDKNVADFDYVLSNEDFSINESGEIDENARIKSRFYLDSEKKILVSDYRTENSTEKTGETNAKSDSLRFGDVTVTGDNTAQITVDLNAMEKAGSNILSSDSQTAAANGSDFQAMLTNQIQKNASEFVRAGNIVLRDNDSGQIKLVLHPENLGNVKIDLQISDKNITGRILVASSQAYNAFKESAESLRNAFVSSGFESASFDLNYSGQGAEQNNGGQNRDNNTQYVISRTYGEYASSVGFDDFDERVDFDAISSKNAVNIVA
ncbi:MAG: hypothetical protein HDR34_09205 [Treponema sp.]|nr:hypothetical protein [Treponema sp.]